MCWAAFGNAACASGSAADTFDACSRGASGESACWAAAAATGSSAGVVGASADALSGLCGQGAGASFSKGVSARGKGLCPHGM